MGCSAMWRKVAEQYDWQTFVKAICRGASCCSKFPKGCMKCLDNFEELKVGQVIERISHQVQ